MYCLHCGECCITMSPLSNGQCPHLVQKDTFYFCSIYSIRPKQCRDHSFFSNFCPIGMNKLGLNYPQDLKKIEVRIKKGLEAQARGLANPNKEIA